ncbi:MAG: MAPEG family protein [Pseudomonadota bacterium]
MLTVTSVFVICLAGLFQWLGINAIRRRRAAGVAVGEGGNDALARAMRAQLNLFEYGTVVAALLALCEINGAPLLLLAAIALVFLGGRLSHAYGLLRAEPDTARGSGRFRWRTGAMAITFTTIPVLAAILLVVLVIGGSGAVPA